MLDQLLPVEPFRGWLRSRLLADDRRAVAAHCGVDERQIHRWMHEDLFVSFIAVDDALTREGTTAIWELAEFQWDEEGRQITVEPTVAMDAYRAVLDEDSGDVLEQSSLFEITPVERSSVGLPAPRYIPQPWDPRPSRHEARRQWRWRLKLARLRRAAAQAQSPWTPSVLRRAA